MQDKKPGAVSKAELVKQNINAVFLQLEVAGRECIEGIMALEATLKKAYEQNEQAKNLAKGVTQLTGQPVANIVSLQETIAQKHATLDNLYSLDDKLKLLDKEVSKVKAVQWMFNLETALKPEEKIRLEAYASGINTILERVDTMAHDMQAQLLKGAMIGNPMNSSIKNLEQLTGALDAHLKQMHELSASLKQGAPSLSQVSASELKEKTEEEPHPRTPGGTRGVS